jgi:hypothetical protein
VSVAFAIVLVGLTGCDSDVFSGPIAVSRDGEHLLIAICRDISVDGFYMSQRNNSDGMPWERFWTAQGSAAFEAGEVISTGGSPPGIQSDELSDPNMNAGTEYAITFVATEPGTNASADLSVRHDLDEDRWLHPDGSVTPEACEQ